MAGKGPRHLAISRVMTMNARPERPNAGLACGGDCFPAHAHLRVQGSFSLYSKPRPNRAFRAAGKAFNKTRMTKPLPA